MRSVFELDPLWDREPVECLEDGGDVVTGAVVGEHIRSNKQFSVNLSLYWLLLTIFVTFDYNGNKLIWHTIKRDVL